MSDTFDRTDDHEQPNAKGGIQSLDTALSLLKIFADFDGPVSLTELARAADMPASKAHRYLASFIHAGFVRQTGKSGRYELGHFTAELGLAAACRCDIVNRTADELGDLSELTGLTAILSVWGNQGATVIRWHRAPSPIVTSFGLGSTLPLLTSASGKIMLAYLPRNLTSARLAIEIGRMQEAKLAWPDMDLTPRSIDGLIERTRMDGVATSDGRYVPGLNAISAPVTNWQNEMEAAVTLISTTDHILHADSPVRAELKAFTRRMSLTKKTA